jgi:drug/metabolite transporter (DMT)-like permease
MSEVYTWLSIFAIVLASTAGDVLMSRAMKEIGDLGAMRRVKGFGEVIRRISRSRKFLLGLLSMALAFFSLLFALSWEDVSVVGPASASITFVANAFAARIFLHEAVTLRRWAAVLLVGGGVFLLAI